MRIAERAAGRAGFTLIEVVVAISITALLLVGARAVFEQLGDHAEAVVAAASAGDREANGQTLVRALVGRVETSPEPERRFDGTADGARFSTWCDTAGGWLERCTATLGFVTVADTAVLAVRQGDAEPVALRRGFRDGRLVYLRSAAEGGSWVRNWSSAVSAPLAVGVVIDGDTAIVVIGERG
jgi:prepilin-type N-terminal cleavage/methylation domain-containing protein